MNIQEESPNQPEIIAMLEKLDAYFGELYPAESNHLMDVASLMQPDVVFLVARNDEGQAAGCGAYVNRGGYAEVKRMYVDPSRRGQGLGGLLMAAIIKGARSAGLPRLRLETGISQPEAIGLYERDGFQRIAPFGDYVEDPLSIYMEKPL